MEISETVKLSERGTENAEFYLEQSKLEQSGEKCSYLAPFICYHEPVDGWRIAQGCCNHWDCPRCGQIRARREYARMVNGAVELENDGRVLYFWTLTCRGKEVTLEEAEKGYLTWTNRLLSTVRAKAKTTAEYWCYVTVTERQKRGHPHSHMINSYCPPDAWPYKKGEMLPLGYRAKSDGLWSDWFVDANRNAGLGEQCQLSQVKSAAAVANYLSVYLFKGATSEIWPKGWKRVRYSNNWPKLPETGDSEAFPVLHPQDWERVLELKDAVRADTLTTYLIARKHGAINVKAPIGWL